MRDRFGERHDAASADRKLVGRAEIGATAKADYVAFATIVRRGGCVVRAAAREAADWFDGADAAAHECGDEAETQKGKEAGEGRALPGETGDCDFTDAAAGQGAALGAGRSRRGVSDGTTAALARWPQGMRRGWARWGWGWLVGLKKMRAQNHSGCDGRSQMVNSAL